MSALPTAIPAPPADDGSPPRGGTRRRLAIVAVAMLAWVAVAAAINEHHQRRETERAVQAARHDADITAGLAETALRQSLAHMDGMAQVLARLPQLQAAVDAVLRDARPLPDDAAARRALWQGQPALAALNAELAIFARELGADLALVIDARGHCIAASNGGTALSAIGSDLGDRQYFIDARDAGHGRQFAVGRTTRVPGLYFSAAVAEGGRFLGVVAVKRDTPKLAATVRHDGVFVADAQGVVILTQDPALQLRLLPGGNLASLRGGDRLDRYQAEQLPPLAIVPWADGRADGVERIGADPRPQVRGQRHMADAALDVFAARPLPDLERLQDERGLAFALLSLAGCGTIAIVAAVSGAVRSRRRIRATLAQLGTVNQSLRTEVAERLRAEADLRQSQAVLAAQEARLRALLRSLPELVWMKDRDGVYVMMNPAYQRFAGLDEALALGRRDEALYPPAEAMRYFEEDQRVMASGESLHVESWQVAADDGRRAMIEVLKTVVRDEQGVVLGVVGIGRDTTAIHLAQQALAASEERFRATFETAGDAILIVRDGIVVDCNGRAAELFGAEARVHLIGQETERLYAAAQAGGLDPHGLADERVEAALLGERHPFEWRCRRLDGEPFDAEVTLSLFTLGGVRMLQAVVRDVSERRRMIVALEQAKEEAERANRSKSIFLANMSHEIRTPLNAVLGFAQLLIADARLPEDAQQRLRVIHAAGHRLLGLISDVLDLAKIESGRLQLADLPFDLCHELRDIRELFEASARQKGLAMGGRIALATPDVVRGDRTKIGQILLNVLGNALKFTEHGSVCLDAARDGDTVALTVTDTGPGIAADELGQLFEPFRQGTVGHEKGGTGLGLALSRDLARAMGGTLEIASTPGQGTQVRIRLPLPAVAEAPRLSWQGGVAQRLAPGQRCRALVVEDDADSAAVLSGLLRSAGCEVVEAGDGLAGLARCESGRFDIVFSDIRMPGLDGIGMIERLRADPARARLPVIAVSASSLAHERRFYIAQGFQDFIGKPYPFDEVYRVLAEHAGLRLVPVAAADAVASDADAAAAPPLADDALRAGLSELAAAAARGELAAVRRCMAALDARAVGAATWQALQAAAQAYDFQALELRVQALLAARGATDAPL